MVRLRTARAIVVALLLALAGLAAAPLAAASTPAGTPPAYLRLAHLSPDTPMVDVYVNSAADPSRSFVVKGVGYGAVSDYKPLPPDSYVISMRAAGAPAGSPPVISTSLDAKSGAAYTVAGTGRSANLGLSVLNDKLDSPPAGKASVRVINAALSTPTADVGPVNGPAWATSVAFGTETNYVDCPLGVWNLKVTSGDLTRTLPLTLEQNSSYTVLLVDKGKGLEPQVKRDSTGAGTVPTGGVNTGLGGTAGPSPLLVAGGAGAALLVAGLLVGVAVRRYARGR
jgi:Domain of unknown function (DUF4397)